MRVVVLGLGVSGIAAAQFLIKQNHEVIGIDKKPIESINCIREENCPKQFDLLVVSPGIAPSNPVYQYAIAQGIEVIGEIELALRHMKQRAIGVTGTNGKTTTVMRIAHTLNINGQNAIACGNIGVPLISLLDESENTIFVVELSSFQLETISSKKFDSSLLLNVTPDHLERYDSFDHYKKVKEKLAQFTKKGRSIQYVENIDGALKILALYGIGESAFWQAEKSFKMAKHRIELIKEIDEILFYNDSKGTNVDSTLYASSKIDRPIILLAGGKDKNLSFKPWKKGFKNSVKLIIAFGETKEKIKSDVSPEFDVIIKDDLKSAFHEAMKRVKKKEAILLSPGCSSFDQFDNYIQRGEAFCQYVKEYYEP
ncbi:MAG: UDP-N-acetylmuramoyl-L-alanine--D-glutamate ligase [Rhabdochlamydiaceae bacterium]|nr:UDP-N-acetylmuramoyl-L-alanine--D-glutamate ligase [Candidatus Amphrikana amoebophyrae]